MTAPCERGDAELVAGLRAGDQGCLAGIYDRYADRLYDFCAGMLRDRDEAADAVQDTFLLVNERIGQLRVRSGCGRGCMRSPGPSRWPGRGLVAESGPLTP